MDIERLIQDLTDGATRAGGKVELHVHGGREEKLASTSVDGVVAAAYDRGVTRAKQAFLGAMAGMAASSLAPNLAKGAIGKMAPRIGAALAKPVAGAMFDTGVGMAANAASNKAFGI